jgi:hypothetical protein
VSTHAQLLEALQARDDAAALRLLESDPALCTEDDVPSALMLAMYQALFPVAGVISSRRVALTLFEAAAMGDTDQLAEQLGVAGAASELADDGFTALHLACFFNRPEAVRLLLDEGAEPDAVATNGSDLRPLHSACAARGLEVVTMLLAAGADPNTRQRGGFTPLHAAAMHGDGEIVEALLAAGGDPGLQDDDGKTAADHARAGGHTEMADRLQQGPPRRAPKLDAAHRSPHRHPGPGMCRRVHRSAAPR